MVSREQRELHATLARKHGPALSIDEALIRLGIPQRPLTDLYYELLRGSWLFVLTMMGVMYVLANLAFAGMYLLGGDCIVGAEPGSYWDAFFFSVQSMSTIGYGAMAPKTFYADVIVTLEAMVGVGGVAMATGLIFAKFSRPSANVRFSKHLLVAPYDGKRSLYFRVANVRGNDVVEAEITVAAAVDQTTAEGHKLRRLENLKLVRDRTPLFRMSWLVIHVIDEDSPLHGKDLEGMYRGQTTFVVTFKGLDHTFAQPVYARNLYLPSSVLVDHHFVDLMERKDSGHLVFDFSKFDEVEPLDVTASRGEAEADEAGELLDAEVQAETEAEAVSRAEAG